MGAPEPARVDIGARRAHIIVAMSMRVFDVISKAAVAVDALRARVRPGGSVEDPPVAPRRAEIDEAAAQALGVQSSVKPSPVKPSRKAPSPVAPPSSAEVSMGDASVPAQIYGRRSCAWCGRALQLLQAAGVDYRFINLDDDEGQPLETALVKETKQYTVPYVYLRGQFIGGYHALDEISRFGQLEQRTTAPEDRKAPRPGELKIVIPKRPE